MSFSEDYEYAVVCKISAYMQFSGSLMNHVLCMLFCDCFQIWILSICNGNQKGTSEMSNWFVGIMPGSLIPLNCEPLTADIHGCLQKTPRMSDCLWLYFHLRSSLSGCFSSLLKFRFDCLWTTLFLVQLCLQVDSNTKIKHIYSTRFQLSLLWTFLLFVSMSSSIHLRISTVLGNERTWQYFALQMLKFVKCLQILIKFLVRWIISLTAVVSFYCLS